MSATTPKIRPPTRQEPRRRRNPLPALLLLAVLGFVAFLLLRPPEPTGPAFVVFPLPERYANAYANDWGAARVQGRHEGTDVFAPDGTPIRSITDGTVSRAWGSSGDGWNTLGGYTVMIEASRDVGPSSAGTASTTLT